ncbi:MAG TPA: UPF0182 family protein, partial [Syntrophorhabdaceae bacterium]|nr:UPF0182 family protein [Syntrophorhabdaceae bacterium]
MQKKTMRLLLIGFAFLIVLIFAVLGMYTDWLFFQEVSYKDVFLTILSGKILAGLIIGVLSFGFIFANILPIVKTKFPTLQISFANQYGIPLNSELLTRLSWRLGLVVSLIIGFLSGLWGSSLWYNILAFANAASTGVQDPVFGKDIGFYLFKLPLYERLSHWAGFMIFLVLALVIFAYAIRGGFSFRNNRLFMTPVARRHVGFLASLFLIKIAFGFYLDRFGLLSSVHNILVGANYTDINARLIALNILIVVTAIAGVA